MTDFVYFVFDYLSRALYLAIPAVILCGVVLAVTAAVFKRKGRRLPWRRAVLWLALLGYLTIVAVVTLFRTGGGGWRYVSLRLFRAWQEAYQSFDQRSWLNILLNIAMFGPLGVLLPLLGRRFRRWYLTLGAGFLLSLAIECIQYSTGLGLADVDDLFCNTLGCLAGYLLVMTAHGLWNKKWKGSLGYALGLAAVLLGISSPFLAYGLQELGNLPEAPAYQVSTKGVTWDILCQLEETAGTASLYRLPVPTKEECADIGRRVLEAMGAEEIDCWYYNDEVYLRSDDRCVSVYYLDGSYDYWEFQQEAAPATLSEDVLGEKLGTMGIQLPGEAVLTVEEDDWYCFTVPAVQAGDTLMDGTVRFQLTGEGTFLDLDNHLLTLTHYREASIISAAAAVERVQAGWLTSGDGFEEKAPKEMEIRSCTLSYQVDTKGFYQPVYLVEVAARDTNYEETVVIPAIGE